MYSFDLQLEKFGVDLDNLKQPATSRIFRAWVEDWEKKIMKGVKHYTRDGKEHTGSSHKMSDGTLHTNKAHTKTSKKLVHFKDLSQAAKKRAKG